MPPEIRPARFAGRLYPAVPEELRARLEGALARVTRPVGGESRGLVLPHAGLEAAAGPMAVGFSRLAPGTRRMLLLGPVHAPEEGGAELLTEPRGDWACALGPVPVLEASELLGPAPEAGRQGSRTSLTDLPHRPDAAAHDREHSLEALVPWVRLLFPAAAILPLLVPPGIGEEHLEGLAGRIHIWLERHPDAALLASTDLDHYHGASHGRTRHARLMDMVARSDERPLRRAVRAGELAPCGVDALWVFLRLARLDGRVVRVLQYGWAGTEPGRVGCMAAALEPSDES